MEESQMATTASKKNKKTHPLAGIKVISFRKNEKDEIVNESIRVLRQSGGFVRRGGETTVMMLDFINSPLTHLKRHPVLQKQTNATMSQMNQIAKLSIGELKEIEKK